MDRVRIVGIAGGSCSGKSTLARALSPRLPGGVLVFGLDSYYRDASGVPDEMLDVDTPDALDLPLILVHLHALAAGRAIERPVYDFRTHTRTSHTQRVEPADWVIVEGLYTLYWPGVRTLLDAAVFLEADPAVCLERRIERDARERGRTPAQTIRVMHEVVDPRRVELVDPTREYADLVLDGLSPVGELVEEVLGLLGKVV